MKGTGRGNSFSHRFDLTEIINAAMNTNSYKGYTLLELLIAMTIAILATLVITKFFITEHRIYTIQEAEAEMYQTLRGALNMFTDELILAGYGLPSGMAGITKFDKDEIEFRTNLRNITSGLSSNASPDQNILSVRDGTGKSFEKGDVIIICKDSHTCEEHALLKDGSNSSMTITPSLGTAFPAGSRIDLMNTISYRYNKPKREFQRKIDRGNWEAVAENIAEDGLTLSYRNRNNDTAADSSEIRRIDITLAVESFRRDAYFQNNNGYRRAGATSAITLRNSL